MEGAAANGTELRVGSTTPLRLQAPPSGFGGSAHRADPGLFPEDGAGTKATGDSPGSTGRNGRGGQGT